MFEKLECYKEVHGDCLVPRKYEADPKLGRWVSSQRKNKKLRVDHRARLDSIGFDWAPGETVTAKEKRWNGMFD